jgi:acetate kinase
MTETILVLNSGSSSIKFQLFEVRGQLERRMKGLIEGIGTRPRHGQRCEGRSLS